MGENLILTRGIINRKMVGFITRRLEVRILSPLLTFVQKVKNKVFFVGTCSFFLSHSSKEESEVHLKG